MKKKTIKGLSKLAIVSLIPGLLAGCGKGYTPDDNKNADVYGGPDMYEQYDSKDNIEPCVYGGPDMYEEPVSQNDISLNDISFNEVTSNDVSSNLKDKLSKKSDLSSNDFDVSENIAEPVYGAPSTLETE